MTTCTTCDGRRTVSITVPNMKGPSNNQYQSNNPPYVTRHYQCETCSGRGRVECARCNDSGYVSAADPYGDYDGDEWCSCDAGELAREDDTANQAQDAYAAMVEAAEFHTHVEVARHTYANPPLNEKPF